MYKLFYKLFYSNIKNLFDIIKDIFNVIIK